MILESVRYCVRCALFGVFCKCEIVSVFKGFREFIVRLTDKFSRPPRCDHFDKPAYEILLNTWAFEVARRRRIRFATFGGRRNKPAYFFEICVSHTRLSEYLRRMAKYSCVLNCFWESVGSCIRRVPFCTFCENGYFREGACI